MWASWLSYSKQQHQHRHKGCLSSALVVWWSSGWKIARIIALWCGYGVVCALWSCVRAPLTSTSFLLRSRILVFVVWRVWLRSGLTDVYEVLHRVLYRLILTYSIFFGPHGDRASHNFLVQLWFRNSTELSLLDYEFRWNSSECDQY